MVSLQALWLIRRMSRFLLVQHLEQSDRIDDNFSS